MNELNKKLALWAGENTDCWQCGGNTSAYSIMGVCSACKGTGELPLSDELVCPNFTESLDLCFKWLVPKLIKDFATELVVVFEYLPNCDKWTCAIEDGFYNYGEVKRVLSCATDNTQAEAFCKAIEKLI